MTHNLKRAVLLLTLVTTSISLHSCKDDAVGTHNDDLYLVTSDNVVDYYYKPKKAFAYTWHTRITGNWFYNDKAGIKDANFDAIFDSKQEYAERYYFLDEQGVNKYLQTHYTNDGERMIDNSDIISPYKEYSQYYKDNGHITIHESFALNNGIQACIMPVIAIDVVCDKDFDADHPAGSKLNDIIKYDQDYDTYTFLHSPEYKDLGENWIPKFEPRQLTDLPENPIYMMNRGYELIFDHTPTTTGTYEFTVKFTFGPDPLTGETVDIAPAKVSIEF